jgi:hypothetical protein
VKNRNGLRTSAVFAIALVVLLLAFNANAAVVWSDNFDDLNYDGWTVITGGFTCENAYLECADVDVSRINHSSDVSAGTWSWDIYCVAGSYINVHFWINEGTADIRFLVQLDGDSVDLQKYGPISLMEWDSPANFANTWSHVDVTMDASFVIDVYVNDSHVIHFQTLDPMVDCGSFKIDMHHIGDAIDNIVVSDTIDVVCTNETCTLEHAGDETTPTTTEPTTTPTTTTTPATTPPPPPPAFPMELIAVGGGVAVVLVVLVIILKRR